MGEVREESEQPQGGGNGLCCGARRTFLSEKERRRDTVNRKTITQGGFDGGKQRYSRQDLDHLGTEEPKKLADRHP